MNYATNGNFSQKSDVGSVYTYGTSSKPYQLTGIETSTGLVSDVEQTVSYTSFEQPLTITETPYQALFTYNADGQRAKMEVKENSNTILTRWYAGSRYTKQTEGSITKEFTWLGGDAYTTPCLAVTQSGATTYYYLLRDHLGTITHVTDASGNVVNEYSFDAWGRRRNFTDWSYNVAAQTDILPDRGFTGHEYLPWFKLYNMNGRLYDPVVGRFLSPDPIISDPSFSQSYNRYAYALNNPLKFNDPDGEFPWLAAGIFAGFSYLKTAYDNRNPVTGKWAWNPNNWFGKDKNTTVIVGINTNTSFSNVTGFTGIGVGPYMPAFAVNSNSGVGFGVYTPQGADFIYPGISQRTDYKVVIGAINKARGNTQAGNGDYSIVNAVNALNENAYISYAAAKAARDGASCARFIRWSLESGFGLQRDALKGTGSGKAPVPARLYGSFLEELGFTEELNLTKYLPGDIAVFQGYPGGTSDKNGIPYGHIQMYNGSQWISNYYQNNFWPNSDYRKYPSVFQIYRMYP